MRVSRLSWQIGLFALCAGACLILPVLLETFFDVNRVQTLNWFGDGFLFIAMVCCWNFFNGSLGTIDLGQITFLGIGAYFTAIAVNQLQIALPLAAIIGIICSVIYALLIGMIILRLQGIYFSVATLAVLIGTRVLIIGIRTLTNGGIGLTVSLPYQSIVFYYLALGVLLGIMSIIWRIQTTAYRSILSAIRHDALLASVRGIPVIQYKLLTYCIAAALMGMVGSVWIYRHPTIDPSIFMESGSFQVVSAALIGGYDSIIGSLVGGVLNHVVFAQFTGDSELVINGLVLILCMRYLQGGLVRLGRASQGQFDWFARFSPPQSLESEPPYE